MSEEKCIENVYPRITPSAPIENKEASDYRLNILKMLNKN